MFDPSWLPEAQASLRRNAKGAAMRGQSVRTRLFGRCERVGDCWEWQGRRYPSHYGQITVNNRVTQASRQAWREAFGEIPDGLWVLHRCDNPPCCNPSHLFLGTHHDNVLDREAKGRTAGISAGLPPDYLAKVRARTHCRRGLHEFTPENTRRMSQGRRVCRACERLTYEARKARAADYLTEKAS